MVQAIPREYNAYAYIIKGEAFLGPIKNQKSANTGQMIIFDNDGEEVEIGAPQSTATTTNNKSALDFLLIGGVPLNEPVARYGPLVMNTEQEILQAVEDYQTGKMGEITIQ